MFTSEGEHGLNLPRAHGLSVGGGGFPEKYRDGVGLPVPSEVDGKEQKYRYHTWTDQEFWTSRLEARLREVIWCQCIVISGTYFSFSDKPITEYQWFMVTELLPQPLWSLYLFGNISQGKPTEKKNRISPSLDNVGNFKRDCFENLFVVWAENL